MGHCVTFHFSPASVTLLYFSGCSDCRSRWPPLIGLLTVDGRIPPRLYAMTSLLSIHVYAVLRVFTSWHLSVSALRAYALLCGDVCPLPLPLAITVARLGPSYLYFLAPDTSKGCLLFRFSHKDATFLWFSAIHWLQDLTMP